MIFYAVIDTNVLVSALLSSHDDAATVQIVENLFSGHFIPVISEAILDEYNEVLRRKKFNFTEKTVRSLITAITDNGEFIIPSPIDEKLPDMKDIPFYEVVMEKRNDNAYLITGNIKHFPKRPYIVTANEFLTILHQKTTS